MKSSLLELRFPSSFFCYIHYLFLHMFLGLGGNKKLGPTSSVPPKKRKCGICKQEGKAVAVFHVMFLWHISQTEVLKPSHYLWLQSEKYNIRTFSALWLTCDSYNTLPLRLSVAWNLLHCRHRCGKHRLTHMCLYKPCVSFCVSMLFLPDFIKPSMMICICLPSI